MGFLFGDDVFFGVGGASDPPADGEGNEKAEDAKNRECHPEALERGVLGVAVDGGGEEGNVGDSGADEEHESGDGEGKGELGSGTHLSSLREVNV